MPRQVVTGERLPRQRASPATSGNRRVRELPVAVEVGPSPVLWRLSTDTRRRSQPTVTSAVVVLASRAQSRPWAATSVTSMA
jgi:hypothetical protein